MITQIEIDGFKTFLDFKVELAPFQVLVGPNASGKSNLFDALYLLSQLAEVDIRSAFQGLRGSPDEQFTLFPNGQRSDHIRFAVELLVDRKVQDELGQKAELKYTRLRYELTIAFRANTDGLERPYVLHESLRSIQPDKDQWCKRYDLSAQNSWLPEPIDGQKTFINTQLERGRITTSVTPVATALTEYTVIFLYPDDSQSNLKKFYADEIQRTILSRTDEVDYPHVFAAREELRSLKFLRLYPEELRHSSSIKAPTSLSPEGKNLAAMLARMQAEDLLTLTDVSRDLADLVPDVIGIDLKKDAQENKYTIWVKFEDERTFPASVLSDGTLLLLALAALKNDPQFRGVFCLEEPENSVHPFYLKKIAHMLRGMATDFTYLEQAHESLRQIIVTTHSPVFISQEDAADSLLFTFTVTRVVPQKYALQITQMTPVAAPSTLDSSSGARDKAAETYASHQIEKYLNSHDLDSAREKLRKNSL
ncbi:MAG TPA: AAA family ATPase [Ktedonobacteraceae bacterium]|nr:AAA family ATPase [Ktedonobacteraceae bacterium]